ncbi:AAA family ATPase [Zavarzinella formosa]|uniref:AAA family ATPase n=1 Tax=Zavarzinella formosa TaxID=360055 RepID=UPI0002D5719D|nr:ATP-binding protein [Zavarzinella formosa]
MIRGLSLENYRGFRRFEMRDLGRVNLIVGTNNAGKTSVLEAIHTVESPADLTPVWASLIRRGEDFEDRESGTTGRQVDIRRIFFGHDVIFGNGLSIVAHQEYGQDRFRAFFSEASENPERHQPGLFEQFDSSFEAEAFSRAVAIGMQWEHPPSSVDASVMFDLTRRGGLTTDALRQTGKLADGRRAPIRLITAASLSPDAVIDLFEEVVLTPAEEFVVEALRIIEPTIERIATSGTDRRRALSTRAGTRGGLLVRCRGVRDRIPIGSMGDGIWRMLGLALALVRTEGGILLVDEIDTGLHYSVMENMWRLVNETANRLRIQVFATTHSRDCYESLAAISRNVALGQSDVTMQRIERGVPNAISYSEREIIAAANRHVEVR